MGGYAIAGITAAYFASPMLNKMNPTYALLGGFFLACSVLAAYERKVLNEKTRFNYICLVSYLIVALVCIIPSAISAGYHLHKLDIQCSALQGEMLNGRPKGSPSPPIGRSDPADAFQALGCRPH